MQLTIEQRFSEVKFFLKSSNWEEFAISFGVNSQTILNYRKGRVKLSDDFLEKVKEIGINPVWLKTGEGSMLIENDEQTNKCGGLVPFYNIDVNATIVNSLDDIKETPEFYVDFKPLNDCTAFLPIFGDSMYPRFTSGEIIAVKQINNPNIILWGEPYLIITDSDANNMRTLKLLYQHPDDHKVILRACNPDFAGDTVINKDNIINLFIVKGKVARYQI